MSSLEGFPTLLALVGVASSMNSLILKKLFNAVEGLPKFIIFAEFFSRWRLLLSSEENAKTKDFVTISILLHVNCVCGIKAFLQLKLSLLSCVCTISTYILSSGCDTTKSHHFHFFHGAS